MKLPLKLAPEPFSHKGLQRWCVNGNYSYNSEPRAMINMPSHRRITLEG